MKAAFELCSLIVLTTAGVLGQEMLVPPYSLHSLTAMDGSIQTSLVFKSLPGVVYQFEDSEDLIHWSPVGDPFYSLGHEHACSLLETAPPPPPETPGGDPPTPATATPPVYTALVLCPASDGGAVVKWRSLDSQALLSQHTEISLDPAWAMVPLYFREFDGHSFFILHQMAEVPAPDDQVELTGADALMWSTFLAALPAMNSEVASSYQLSLAAPPPAPPLPGVSRFLRVRADGSVDTDGDGTPDWMEFAYEPDPAHPDGPVGDPFNQDTDSDGVPDGLNLDFDKDGAPDVEDAVASDPSIYWQRSSAPKFAVFPLPAPGEHRILHAGNDGAVLYEHGVWTEGEFQALNLSGTGVEWAEARAMNSKGQILGIGRVAPPPELPQGMPRMMWWPTRDSDPLPIEKAIGSGSTIFPNYTEALAANHIHHETILDDEGGFFAGLILRTDDGVNSATEEHQGNHYWLLPGQGGELRPVELKEGESTLGALGSWWTDYSSDRVTTRWTGTHGDEEFNGHIREVIPLPDGGFAAIRDYISPAVLVCPPGSGAWKNSQALSHFDDVSSQGWAMSTVGDFWANGISYRWPESAPGIPDSWRWVSPQSMTTGGALLVTRPSESDSAQEDHALGIPIEVEDQEFATGVDAVSVTSSEPGEACEDRLWIMAPAGGTNTFHLRTTAAPHSQLKLASPGGFTFGSGPETTIASAITTPTASAPEEAESQDFLVTIKSGNAASLSKPLGVKVMKKRTVKVAVWRVAYDDGTPGGAPPTEVTDAEIKERLDDVFEPQINVTFEMVPKNLPGPVNFELPVGWGEGSFDTTAHYFGLEAHEVRDACPRDPDVHINVYLIGACRMIYAHILDSGTGTLSKDHAAAVAIANHEFDGAQNPNGLECWVMGDSMHYSKGDILDTIAHEIGHCLVGPGHPDETRVSIITGEPIAKGPAPLPGTNRVQRLMCSGSLRKKDGSSKLLVKGEWDAADERLGGILSQ
ncbi:thrombospondin type 3 repeat-containing protein [Haloferula sargassicola]